MDVASLVGTFAAIFMVLGYLPQTVRTIRTRSTDDIALGTFLLMALGGLCFFIQGIMTHNIPLAVTNAFTTTMSAVIFGIKMVNDTRKRRKAKNNATDC